MLVGLALLSAPVWNPPRKREKRIRPQPVVKVKAEPMKESTQPEPGQKFDPLKKWLARAELKELPNILRENEKVLNIVQGVYEGFNGILCATDRRLVFIGKGIIRGLKVEDFAYDKISSIQYQVGMLMGKMTLFTSGNKANIEQVYPKEEIRDFAEEVRARISAPKPSSSVQVLQAPPAQPQPDRYDQLEKLARLKGTGVMTEEEFQVEKRRILDGPA